MFGREKDGTSAVACVTMTGAGLAGWGQPNGYDADLVDRRWMDDGERERELEQEIWI